MDATSPVDPFAWWRDALEGRFGPVRDGHPEPGFYRYKGVDGRWIAVYAGAPEGDIIGQRVTPDGRAELLNDAEMARIWNWCSKHPITHEAFVTVYDGKPFPDDALQGAEIGHNRQFDELTDIQTEIEELKEIADAFIKQIGGKIATQAHADRAGNLAAEFNVLETKAEDARKKAKRPHLDANKKIDADWQPVTNLAMLQKSSLKNLVATFLVAERKRREKAAAEAAAAAAAQAAERNEPPPPPDFAPVKVKAGGASGKSISLREVKTLAYDDYAKTCAHYAKQEKFWQHPNIMATVGKLAEIAITAGIDVPGAKLEITEQAV